MTNLTNEMSSNKNYLQNVKKGNINDINNYINNVSTYNFIKNV